MKTKRSLTIAAIVVALAALLTISAIRGTRIARAQDRITPPQPERISFGMVGITQGQTIRLNVTNISDVVCPCSRVVLTFLDADGRRFRHRDGTFIRRVVELEPGRATFLDLNADDFQFPPGPTRLQLRAVVNVFPTPWVVPPPVDGVPPPVGDNPPPVPDRIVTSVEIFNNNGRTVFALAAPPSVRTQAPPIGD